MCSSQTEVLYLVSWYTHLSTFRRGPWIYRPGRGEEIETSVPISELSPTVAVPLVHFLVSVSTYLCSTALAVVACLVDTMTLAAPGLYVDCGTKGQLHPQYQQPQTLFYVRLLGPLSYVRWVVPRDRDDFAIR